jgi:hypothetical protein
MTGNGWVKLHRTILTDSRVRGLSPSHRWTFVAYLMIAQHEGRWRGYLTDDEGRNLTGTEKAALAGLGDRSVVLRHERDLLDAGLLVRTDGDRLKIKNYDKYQAKTPAESVAEPVAKMQQAEPVVANVVANVVAEPVAELQQTSTESTAYKKRRSKEEETTQPTPPTPVTGADWAKQHIIEGNPWYATAQNLRRKLKAHIGSSTVWLATKLRDTYGDIYTPAQVDAQIDKRAAEGWTGVYWELFKEGNNGHSRRTDGTGRGQPSRYAAIVHEKDAGGTDTGVLLSDLYDGRDI